jgi:hypothetical protein
MKISFQILFLALIISCQPTEKIEKTKGCVNETELLKGNSTLNASIDLNLMPEEQVQHLQKQVDVSLCRGATAINGEFSIDTSSFENLIILDWYCVDSTNYLDEQGPPCVLIRSKQILINSEGQILIDGNLIKVDSISDFISQLSIDFFWRNEFKRVAYEVKWDIGTDNRIKFQVFAAVRDGYLKAADKISMEQYQSKKLCELDSIQLQELKKKFRLAFTIEKELPVPPPPPGTAIDIEEETIEIEINE